MAEPLKILVDANVWLDYGIATSENHESLSGSWSSPP